MVVQRFGFRLRQLQRQCRIKSHLPACTYSARSLTVLTINTKGNTTAEIVTYTIQDANDSRYYVDEYSPDEYYELSEYAEIPVYVKTVRKRSGDIGYSFCVQTNEGSTRGEHF